MHDRDRSHGLVVLVVGLAAVASSVVQHSFFADVRWWNLAMIILLVAALGLVIWRARAGSR
jgi:uncharacterized protein (DUF983 family)